jgi:trans-2,3-dihydro-3-hydroxyanthranilate isomerase
MRSYVIVDVFTDVALEGNPLAVFTDADGLGGDLMQRTARELNLSETVFLLPAGADSATARARIFTPATELPFAGHPVLGTAFVLGQRDRASSIALETGAGVIEVSLQWAGERITYGEMGQPIPTWQPLERPAELLRALGVERSELPVEVYDNGPQHTFVALTDERAVAGLEPDLPALAKVGTFGVSCFARAGELIKTRMFAPALGVPEDPATGSAAGPLAVHLARHGWTNFGRQIEIRQGVEIGRPSVLHATAKGSSEQVERVLVGGGAVIVAHGEYLLP